MLTVTDLFCGAGGSSLGAESAGYFTLQWALNHWELAIKTHNRNFPHANHDCTDISACNPKRYGSTNILIASPECTNHTRAKGQKRTNQKQMVLLPNGQPDPAEERSRATMWDVPRFAEVHRYDAIVVENVVDARLWLMWDAWILAMQLLGYEYKCVYFNSMFAHLSPGNDFVPQSRDRIYVVFWKKGNKAPDLEFRPLAYCEKCGKDVEAVQVWKKQNCKWGLYGKRGQYTYKCPHDLTHDEVTPYYYGAWTAIDFDLPIEKIGDRKKPLVDRTIKRIEEGIRRFGKQAIVVRNYSPGYSKPADEPLGSVTTADHHSLLIPPFLVHSAYTHGHNRRQYDTAGPMPTLNTNPSMFLFTPAIFNNQGKGSIDGLDEPYNTILSSPGHKWLLTLPFLHSYQNPDNPKGLQEPMATVTTKDKHGLVIPPSFTISYANGDGPPRPTNDPLHTLSTGYNSGMVVNIDPENIDINQCGYRILQPKEIKAGMAFPEWYVIEGTSNKDIVKQCGNAVTPPVMKMLLERIALSLA
jgi:DNA (cytosine-5)-methyltransferase 1